VGDSAIWGDSDSWVLPPLASKGRAGFPALTHTWTGLSGVEEWKRRQTLSRCPDALREGVPCPLRRRLGVCGGACNWPPDLKSQTQGSHRPPAEMAAVRGLWEM
jgi:hypothetical protein